jgi:hypothetical protein
MNPIGLMVRSVAVPGIANFHVPMMRRVSNHGAAPILRDAPKMPMSGKPDIGGRSASDVHSR